MYETNLFETEDGRLFATVRKDGELSNVIEFYPGDYSAEEFVNDALLGFQSAEPYDEDVWLQKIEDCAAVIESDSNFFTHVGYITESRIEFYPMEMGGAAVTLFGLEEWRENR